MPGVGNVIEQLADELRVSPEGDEEYLHVRLEYAGFHLFDGLKTSLHGATPREWPSSSTSRIA